LMQLHLFFLAGSHFKLKGEPGKAEQAIPAVLKACHQSLPGAAPLL